MTRARDLSKFANSQAFSVDSDFQVGINSTVPAATLDVRGDSVITGILTATSFSGTVDATGLTGSPSITVTDITASGNVSIAGTLTYEDVTNIDAVGVITARSDVSIADKIIHTGDTNTAIRFPAADTFTVETGGSERIRVGAAGSVGIGSDDPKAALDVTGDQSAGYQAQFTNSSGSNRARIYVDGNGVALVSENFNNGFEIASNTARIYANGGERLRIDSSGRLLVNTTSNIGGSTNALLHLVDASGPEILFGRNDSTTAAGQDIGKIRFFGNDGGSYQETATISAQADLDHANNDKPGRLIFSTTADGASTVTERLRIDSNGNIGVNQTSINSSRKMEITQPSSYTSGLRINSAGGTGNGAYFEVFVGSANYKFGGDHNTNALLFKKDGTEYMRHDSSGRLLIGHTSSINTGGVDSQLQVVGTDTEKSSLCLARFVNDSGEPFLTFAKSRNGTKGGNTVVQDDDILGRITFQGADGTDYEEAASIKGEVDGTPADDATDMPGRLVFSTTADGDHNATERLRIDSNGNFIFKNGALIENGSHDDGGGITGDYNHDLGTYGNVHYLATNAAGSFTYNLRINSSTSVNSVMAEGDTLSFTLISANNNTARYMTAFKIDGTTITPEWSGGSAPSAATGSGFDVYSFTCMKTGNAAFKVFASFTNHD